MKDKWLRLIAIAVLMSALVSACGNTGGEGGEGEEEEEDEEGGYALTVVARSYNLTAS